MKKFLSIALSMLMSLFVFAEDDKNKNTEEAIVNSSESTEKVEIFKGMYLNMTDEDTYNYIIKELDGEVESHGEYLVDFLGQEVFMRPIFENDRLSKVEIVFRSEDVGLVESNLIMLEKVLNGMEGWTEFKATTDQWLFEKDMDNTIQQMNQLTVYTYGIHRDEIGHGWHAQVQFAPRFDSGIELTEEEMNEKREEVNQIIN
ncbi:hypothetical protein [Flammeovirga sp. SubArs3]|uniref:hypothetical protein n=1 Tax=Flammeovirga sp. SubArs3 TaxID=2995316 RepID=UPI00248BBD34|nr:hypothetical protein [Flammeovirga sp. SubArs3]